MNNNDKEKIENIIADRKKANNFFKKNSNVFRAFLEMEKKAYQDGNLSKLQKELIAIGISVVLNCESCMEWHIKEAIEAGATDDQIIESIGVGIEMSGGTGTVSARFAMKVLEYHRLSV